MKILTAEQMHGVDLRTMEIGIPGLVLMENAGHRVAEWIAEKFAPLARQRIVVLCGKGNNGGDGFVVARQLHTRLRPQSLDVVFAGKREDLRGDAAANLRMLEACGCPVRAEITPEMRGATVVVDALLGTGLSGPARGRMLELIREINAGFPEAAIVAVDIPSGLASDTGALLGEAVRADCTVTFTAPKVGQVLPPSCDRVGELRVAPIGSPPELYEQDASVSLFLSETEEFRHLFAPRPPDAHKGTFGHALVVGGSRGKTGAAAMTGAAALRAGAGLVTVASAESAVGIIAAHMAEIMTEPLPENDAGGISTRAFDDDRIARLIAGKSVVAVGPGLGTHAETATFVRRLIDESDLPMVIDADGLNALAGQSFRGRQSLILTPHPGEMARLAGVSRDEVLNDRLGVARSFATEHSVCLVLKGHRTLIALPDGRVWVNPTGSPAMATGGTGDILTGLIAGLLAQFPEQFPAALLAAVWLHGRAGELSGNEFGEQALTATDMLQFLPAAIEESVSGEDAI